MRLFTILSVIMVVYSVSFGQTRNRHGLLTKVNVNTNIDKTWKWNSTLESRQIFREVFRNPDDRMGYRYERTDWTNIVSKRVGLTGSGAAGYMLRFTGEEWIHRSIQQYAWTQKRGAVRWGHRIRWDQTWRSGEDVTWRFRYRLGFDVPLSGTRLDAREWYWKASSEYIPILQSAQLSFEARVLLALGHYISDTNKIEVGWDGRATDDFETTAYQSWLTVTWYYSI